MLTINAGEIHAGPTKCDVMHADWENCSHQPLAPYIAGQQQLLRRLGGRYIPDCISEQEEKFFLRRIDGAEWITDLKRRVQHYGYRYDYTARSIVDDMRIGDLPQWVMPLAERLGGAFFGKLPQQVIVNEYEPGQGIAPHVDCEPCFGDVVVSVSLGSTCVMDLARRDAGKANRVADSGCDGDRIQLFLEPRSAVVLSGDSRHRWTHGIAPRKKDAIGGGIYHRRRRVSLTFRTVLSENRHAGN